MHKYWYSIVIMEEEMFRDGVLKGRFLTVISGSSDHLTNELQVLNFLSDFECLRYLGGNLFFESQPCRINLINSRILCQYPPGSKDPHQYRLVSHQLRRAPSDFIALWPPALKKGGK